jgi:hypothetical protein
MLRCQGLKGQREGDEEKKFYMEAEKVVFGTAV